jgi:hypothetical protein
MHIICLCKSVQVLGLNAHKAMEGPSCSFFNDIRRFLTVMVEQVTNVKPNRAMLETVDYKAQTKDFFHQGETSKWLKSKS